jgi:aryl-alcohol dehydrogenase-like predicted oxidoreductase
LISNAYVTVGRSGLRVSPFTLGTMTFGEDAGWGASPAEAAAILAAYLDRGGNSIDTANIYTGGHSEKIIGDWFAAHPDRRDRVVLGTKFSGKYARSQAAPGVFGTPSERDYQVIEATRQVAAELEVSPAAVALAWVQGRPGITSVIIGARRAGQLEANLAALDVTLTPGQRRRLAFGGATVDGQSWNVHPALATATTRY